MNIFNIITTILGLIISIYSTFKNKDKKSHNQTNNTIIRNNIINISHSTTTSEQINIDNDNSKFKSKIFNYIILSLFFIITLFEVKYSYTTLELSDKNILISLVQLIYFSLFNTAKSFLPYLFVLSCYLVYKNYKDENNEYRLFHIICYTLLAVSVIINRVFLSKLDYKYFLPYTTPPISTTNLFQFFLTYVTVVLPIIQISLITFYIFNLSHACIFGEYKSPLLHDNFTHIVKCLLAPIFFFLFALYLIFLKKV